MRREVLQAAVRRVLTDLEDTGINQMIDRAVLSFRDKAKDTSRVDWFDLASLTKYLAAYQQYGRADHAVVSILELDSLADVALWQSQMREIDAGFIYEIAGKINRAKQFLPRMMDLLDREYDSAAKNEAFGADDVAVQTVILTDEGNFLSSPTRLVELLVAVQAIYGVIGEVEGVPDASLAVVSMDSGSEKSFDFLGIARLVHELRETLQVVYNMITFHKQNVTLKNLQIAGETMSLVSKISKLEKAESLSGDEASRLKQKLFAGLEKFSSTGAYIPEMSAVRELPALAMRPQPRMLTGPASSIVREGAEADVVKGAATAPHNPVGDEVGSQEFSSEELVAAARLLRAASTSSEKVVAARIATPPKRVRKRPIKVAD